MLQDFVGDFHATSRHQRQDAGSERIERSAVAHTFQSKQISSPSSELMGSWAGRLVNHDEPRRQALLKRPIVGRRPKIVVRGRRRLKDVIGQGEASNKATTCSSI